MRLIGTYEISCRICLIWCEGWRWQHSWTCCWTQRGGFYDSLGNIWPDGFTALLPASQSETSLSPCAGTSGTAGIRMALQMPAWKLPRKTALTKPAAREKAWTKNKIQLVNLRSCTVGLTFFGTLQQQVKRKLTPEESRWVVQIHGQYWQTSCQCQCLNSTIQIVLFGGRYPYTKSSCNWHWGCVLFFCIPSVELGRQTFVPKDHTCYHYET